MSSCCKLYTSACRLHYDLNLPSVLDCLYKLTFTNVSTKITVAIFICLYLDSLYIDVTVRVAWRWLFHSCSWPSHYIRPHALNASCDNLSIRLFSIIILGTRSFKCYGVKSQYNAQCISCGPDVQVRHGRGTLSLLHLIRTPTKWIPGTFSGDKGAGA